MSYDNGVVVIALQLIGVVGGLIGSVLNAKQQVEGF